MKRLLIATALGIASLAAQEVIAPQRHDQGIGFRHHRPFGPRQRTGGRITGYPRIHNHHIRSAILQPPGQLRHEAIFGRQAVAVRATTDDRAPGGLIGLAFRGPLPGRSQPRAFPSRSRPVKPVRAKSADQASPTVSRIAPSMP